jgi:CelD/BcsL family acetyltransferase involved in cellulose biosynthesis
VSATIALPLRIGARTVASVRRRLVRRPFTLAEALASKLPNLPPLEPEAHGYLITSLPAQLVEPLVAAQAGFRIFIRQRYCRSYASLEQSFDDYLAGFSSKSRSTLRRKQRRLAERSGGTLDVRGYRTPAEIEEFYRHARAVSATTYQEQLLDAGLPQGKDALAEMRRLAAADALRAWLLFVDGQPISYLYAPADRETLIYAYLGYDPAFAEYSPGTVLQLEAMRELMAERRFRLFDFTEGDGQHKRQFGTGTVECVDLLLLRRSLPNLVTGHLLNGFDGGVGFAKRVVSRLGLEKLARRVRR